MNSHPIIQLIHEISMQIPKLDPLRPCDLQSLVGIVLVPEGSFQKKQHVKINQFLNPHFLDAPTI